MSQRFSNLKFQSLSNPFGIQYNIASISKSLHRIVSNELYTQDELFLHPDQNVWLSLDHHSSYNGENIEDVLDNINGDLSEAREYLKSCERCFITLGSAYVFDTVTNNDEDSSFSSNHHSMSVANCHKLPPSYFARRLQSIDEITQHILQCITSLMSLNPNVSITFTVSPIRHWKDGPIENTLSKSHLIAALHNAIQTFQSKSSVQNDETKRKEDVKIDYFPSYEIVMDELRDYRFYEEDMLHPTKVACDYIFQRLLESHFDLEGEKDKVICKKVESINKALQHKPFRPDSDEYHTFLEKQLEEMDKLENVCQWMDFGTEREEVLKRLGCDGVKNNADERDMVLNANGGLGND